MKRPAVEQLLYIALALLLVLTSISGYFLAVQIHGANKSQQVIRDLVDQIKSNQEAENKKILDHIDCIGLLLSQANRANLKIADLNNCKLDAISSSLPATQTTMATVITEPPAPTAPQRNKVVSPVMDGVNRLIKRLGL